jgi:hypothetical protein
MICRPKAVLDAITVEGMAEATGGKTSTQSAYHYVHYIEPVFADLKLPVSALDFKDPPLRETV